MKISSVFKSMSVSGRHTSPTEPLSLFEDSVIRGAVPLRDILTGVFNGSPIPPDYLGEPHADTDDTPVSDVDPYACFGYDRLDREEYVMNAEALRVDNEGNRARTARSRVSNPTGSMGTPGKEVTSIPVSSDKD